MDCSAKVYITVSVPVLVISTVCMPLEVRGVVELELAALEAQLSGIVEEFDSINKTSTDLSSWCKESVVSGSCRPIGPRHGVGGRHDSRLQTLSPCRIVSVRCSSAELTDIQRCNTRNIQRGHTGTAEHLVSIGGISAKNLAARGCNVWFQSQVIGASSGGV